MCNMMRMMRQLNRWLRIIFGNMALAMLFAIIGAGLYTTFTDEKATKSLLICFAACYIMGVTKDITHEIKKRRHRLDI